MLFKCLLVLLCLAYIEARLQDITISQVCPRPVIQNGFFVVIQRSKRIKFFCLNHYQFVGNRYANCRNGEWDVPLPVCVKSGCPELPRPANATQNKMHSGAWLETFCLPGFQRNGSLAIYCDGHKWNATSPTCVVSAAETKLSCDFENPDICGWTQDELHDFDWRRINNDTPSHYLGTGPAYDHTLGQGYSGYYMYIESSGRAENDKARLLSPIFDAHLATSGCFSFFYHMYGEYTGALRIYQKPDSLQLSEMMNMSYSMKLQYILFEQWRNLGDFWYSDAPALKDFKDDFQIVIEGIRGRSFSSDIAIDDVAILQGINCTYFRNAATSPPSQETITPSSTTQNTSIVFVSSTSGWVTTTNQATTTTNRLTTPGIVTSISETFSPWKIAVITIVVLSVFVGLIYLGVTLRPTRGKLDLARLRGRDFTTHDAVLHYHNSIDDQTTDGELINE